MEQISVFDSRFAPYGQVLEGYDFAELLRIMEETTPCPEDGTVYVASVPELEVLSVAAELRDRGFGGMPIQIGYCNGANTRLSCLEYHRTSELDIAVSDMVLLVARQPEIVGGVLDTGCVKAFFVPKGTAVELYATTLHYAPAAVGHSAWAVFCPEGPMGMPPGSRLWEKRTGCSGAQTSGSSQASIPMRRSRAPMWASRVRMWT